MQNIQQLVQKAAKASIKLAQESSKDKNNILQSIKLMIKNNTKQILQANELDIANAKNSNLSDAFIDRLTLNEARLSQILEGIDDVIALDDPIGVIDKQFNSQNLCIKKTKVPLGVVGVIYESRPNVTVDIAILCLKSGNVCVLKGGKEAFNTNLKLFELMQRALSECQKDPNYINFIDNTQKDAILELLAQDKYVDVIIPRGGESLHRLCQKNSSIPVIIGGFGISHIFIDKQCNLQKAMDILVNAKTQKPSACNALDTILVHSNYDLSFYQMLSDTFKAYKVKIYAHGKCFDYLHQCHYPYLYEGQKENFDEEFLSLAMNVAMVDDVYQCIEHLHEHMAIHSDTIITDIKENAKIFLQKAPSACVYVNASTRFSDGGQFGFGAEVAISTQKLHVRGPMGLNELTSYHYEIEGDYCIRK